MLVVPFVARISFNGTYGTRPWTNILDVYWNVSGSSGRAAGLSDLADQAGNTWDYFIRPEVVADCVLADVTVLDIDSSGGSSFTKPIGHAGTYSGQGLPPNVAVLGVKQTAHNRSQRNGRWYQCGCPKDYDDSTDPGALTSTGGLAYATALDGIRTGMTGSFGGGTVSPVVVSKGPTVPEPLTIISLVPEGRFGTQRRRQRK